MRPLIITALLTAGIFCSVLYTACTKSKCGGVTCQNGSTCTSDKCVCQTGYSGSACERAWSDAAVGTYTCQRSGCTPAVAGGAAWQGTVVKAASNAGFTINFTNFDNSNKTIMATIDSNNNIKISPTTGTYGINASGTYADGKINLHFTTSAVGGAVYSCNMTMEKL